MLYSGTYRKRSTPSESLLVGRVLRFLILVSGIGLGGLLHGQSAALLEPLELAQLDEMRNGILVVTLEPNTQSGIVADNRADAWKAQQAAEDNRALIEAFTKHYTYSELAFIYSDQLNALRDGERDGLLLTSRLTPFPPQFSKDKMLFICTVRSDPVPAWTDVKRYKRDELMWSHPKGAASEDAMRLEKLKVKYKADLQEMLASDSVKVNGEMSDIGYRPLSEGERRELELELSKMDQVGYVPRNGAFLHERLKYSPNYTEAGGMLIERLEDRVINRSPKKIYVVNFHHFQRIDWQASAQLRFEAAVKTLQSKLDERTATLERRVSSKK